MMTVQRFLANPFVKIQPRLSIAAVIALSLLGVLGGAPTSYGQSQQIFSLVWSDEFNSDTSSNLDTTKWTYDTGNNNGWGNNELEFYTSRTNNAYVAGGLLHIHAQIENTNTVSHSVTNTYHYTSARIKTQGLFNMLYGRIEWRAKLPAGTGMWPALWMMGSNSVSVPWPGCGEIDVVENDGANPTFVQGSIHSGTDATQIYNFTGDSVTNFHVYDLDWTTNSITWSVDGTAYETQTSWGTSVAGKSYPYPFNQPFYLLMNLAVGGDYVNDPTTNNINPSLPNEMQVDYVRVYQYYHSVDTVHHLHHAHQWLRQRGHADHCQGREFPEYLDDLHERCPRYQRGVREFQYVDGGDRRQSPSHLHAHRENPDVGCDFSPKRIHLCWRARFRRPHQPDPGRGRRDPELVGGLRRNAARYV